MVGIVAGDGFIEGVSIGADEPIEFVATGDADTTARGVPIVMVVTIAGGIIAHGAIVGFGAIIMGRPMCDLATIIMEAVALGCVAEPIGPAAAIGGAVIVAAWPITINKRWCHRLVTRDGQAATIASRAFSRRLAGEPVLDAAILLSSAVPALLRGICKEANYRAEVGSGSASTVYPMKNATAWYPEADRADRPSEPDDAGSVDGS